MAIPTAALGQVTKEFCRIGLKRLGELLKRIDRGRVCLALQRAETASRSALPTTRSLARFGVQSCRTFVRVPAARPRILGTQMQAEAMAEEAELREQLTR